LPEDAFRQRASANISQTDHQKGRGNLILHRRKNNYKGGFKLALTVIFMESAGEGRLIRI
jgi:hypothetical protein